MAIRRVTCRCGRLLVGDDETLSVSHEYPECDWFAELMRQVGADRTGLEYRDTVTGNKIPGKIGQT